MRRKKTRRKTMTEPEIANHETKTETGIVTGTATVTERETEIENATELNDMTNNPNLLVVHFLPITLQMKRIRTITILQLLTQLPQMKRI